jgi:hypothetical protein
MMKRLILYGLAIPILAVPCMVGQTTSTPSVNQTSEKLGTQTATQPQLSVKQEGQPPDHATLSLIRGQTTRIVLKNEDNVPHTLNWEVNSPSTPSQTLCKDKNLVLAAKGVGFANCTPLWPNTLGYLQNLFKADGSRGGYQLVLYDAEKQSPPKIIAADATADYIDPTSRQWFKNIALIVILAVGGTCSLLLNFYVPNKLQRLNANEKLAPLARKTADLSSRIDSRLAVLLRLERSRLDDLLKSRWTLSPDFSGVVGAVLAEVPKLQTRVDLAQQIDIALQKLEKLRTAGVPPSLRDEIETSLQKAEVQLGKTDPSDADTQAAQALIADISTRVDALTQPSADFGRKLANDIHAMLSKIVTTTSPPEGISAGATYARIIGEVPWPLAQLAKLENTDQTVPPGTEADFDMALHQINLIIQYVEIYDNAKGERLSRLNEREQRLVDRLRRRSWEALRSTRLLLREMKDDVYPEDLRAALLADGQQVFIDINPRVAYESEPLELSVRFNNHLLNTSAAREEWFCCWRFGDNLEEKGWSVSHYYLFHKNGDVKGKKSFLPKQAGSSPPAEAMTDHKKSKESTTQKFSPEIVFTDEHGEIVNDKKLPLRVQGQVLVRPSKLGKRRERIWIESVKLVAALLIAVFGLLAGAQGQLDKLDVLPAMIAVFLLGFGADSIKNVLTSKSS